MTEQATCPTCEQSVRVTIDGALYEHNRQVGHHRRRCPDSGRLINESGRCPVLEIRRLTKDGLLKTHGPMSGRCNGSGKNPGPNPGTPNVQEA